MFKNKFLTANFWVFSSIMITNLGSYFFHLILGRLLGPLGYGILESTISLLYLISIPLLTLSTVLIKFISEYKGKSDTKNLSGIYFYLREKILFYGLIGTFILLLLTPFIKNFLHIDSWILSIFVISSFLISFFPILNKSVIQGMSDFFSLAITSFVDAVTRLGFPVLFVLLGFKVEGVMGGLLLSAIVVYLFSLQYLKKYNFKKNIFSHQKRVLGFSIPVLFLNLGLTSLFTTDIILVRHFFPGNISGYYAALSILGKIIYFTVSPLIITMFPMISENHARGEKYSHYLILSIGIAGLFCGILTGIYFLLPKLMILILFGNKYISISPLLGFFGVFISLYSLAALISNFYLSIHKTIVAYFVLGSAILQIIGIFMFHKNVMEVINISIITIFLLLCLLLIYYPLVLLRTKSK